MTAEIGYAVVLADQLDQGRSLSMQFNFARGASAEEMNGEIDKLVGVMARQRARAEISGREQYLKAQQLILKNLETDIERGQNKLAVMEPDAMRRNKDQATKSLADALEKQKIVVEDVRGKIAAAEAELADLKQKAA